LNIKWSKLIWIVAILIIASVLTHVADKWTVPLQNETTMAQVNGGDADMVVMHSSNSILQSFRLYIWPIAILLCAIIMILETRRTFKELTKETEEKTKLGNIKLS